MSKRTILAYSGGLDTSVVLHWLAERGHQVIAYLANVGQEEDFDAAAQRAREIGALDVRVLDLREELVRDFVFPAIQGSAVYEGRYLLGTALARPLIALHQVRLAHQLDAPFVSHGATGKGNDQVRFELAYYALDPQIQVVAPWKDREFLDRFQGRGDLLEYAARHRIPVTATIDKPHSEDENLVHTSHEAGVLEDPGREPEPAVFSRSVSPQEAPDRETRISIEFRDGLPTRVENHNTGEGVEGALPIFLCLNELGRANAIGRVDMVENRFVGIKSRGIYETPGATILHIAHRDIEGIAMDREVLRLRNMLSPKLAELIYSGFWFSPEMDFLQAAIRSSQEVVDGVVQLSLYKGNVTVLARESPSSLYDADLASMDIAGGFDQADAEGFIRVHATRLKAHHAILQHRGKDWAGS